MKAVGAWTEPAELKKAADERVATKKATSDAEAKAAEVKGRAIIHAMAGGQVAEVEPAVEGPAVEPTGDVEPVEEPAQPSEEQLAEEQAALVAEAFAPAEDAAKVTKEFIAETVGADA
jgi:hypothetical protein